MNRTELLWRVADEVSTIVAGALAATGEDDDAYWDLVQKLRHKYGLPLLIEAEVQAGIRRYAVLTRAHSTVTTLASSAALNEFAAERSARATRADLRAVVVVEAALRIEGPLTVPM